MVAVVCFFLNRRKIGGGLPVKDRLAFSRTTFGRPSVGLTGFFCALSVPAVCLVSAAVLSAGGMTPNRNVLAGIAAGVGTAVAAIILCSEKLKRCNNLTDARSSLRRLHGPLIAGSVTTVAALLPIPAMNQGDAGVIAVSIAVVTLVALFFSLCPLPPLLLWGLQSTGSAGKTDRQMRNCPRRIINHGGTRSFNSFFCFLAPTLAEASLLFS
jgi:hypothetical protein